MKMLFAKQVAALAFGFLALSGTLSAASTADEIMVKSNHAAFYQGDDGRAEARMKIVDAQGREQMRQFTILRKDRADGGDQDFYVIFSKPTEVNRTAFLVNKHVQSDDDRWLYLPSLDLVKRIAASDKRTSFVGSHFYYEDISGRNLSDDTYELLSQDGQTYQIKATPKTPDSAEFAYYVVSVDKASYLPMKAEYFDASGNSYRIAEVLKVETVQGIATGTMLKMTDHKQGGYTLTQMRFVEYNKSLPDDVFSERSLRIPPVQWLKR